MECHIHSILCMPFTVQSLNMYEFSDSITKKSNISCALVPSFQNWKYGQEGRTYLFSRFCEYVLFVYLHFPPLIVERKGFLDFNLNFY